MQQITPVCQSTGTGKTPKPTSAAWNFALVLVSTLIHLNFVVAITVIGLSASAEVTPQLKGFLCIFIHGYKDIYSPVTSKPTQEFVSVTFHSYSALTHRQNIFKVQNGENAWSKKGRKKVTHHMFLMFSPLFCDTFICSQLHVSKLLF